MWKRPKHRTLFPITATTTPSRLASGSSSSNSRSIAEVAVPSTSRTSMTLGRPIPTELTTPRTFMTLGRSIPAGPSTSRTSLTLGRPIPAEPSTSRSSSSIGRPTSSRTTNSRTSVPIGAPVRVSKRHIDSSDDEIERRAADRKPSHSGEKKKKYNEDHLRLQRMLRNSVLNDSRRNLISERRKLEQENESYRLENKRLNEELDQSRSDLQAAKTAASLKETVLKQQSELFRKEVKSKDKLIEQKTSEASKLRRDLAAMESQISEASTSSAASATALKKQPDSEFFLDVLANLKESIENQFSCSICTEVFINSTTLHCGHTYCTDCLEEWEKQNATCPVCRADIKCKHPTKILDGYIDKFISQYYSEDAKAARTTLKEDRVKQVAQRAQAAAHSRTLEEDFFNFRMVRVNQLLRENRRGPLLSHSGRLNLFRNRPTGDEDDDDEEYTPARSSTQRTSASSASSVQSFTIRDINEIFRTTTPPRVPRRNIYESDDDDVIALGASDESNNTLNLNFPYDDYQPAPQADGNYEPDAASESTNDTAEPDAPSESGSSDHAGNNTDHDEEEDDDDFDNFSFSHLSSSIGRLSSSFSHSSDGAVFSSSTSDSDDED